MKYLILVLLFGWLTACHRPVAYFQREPRPFFSQSAAAKTPIVSAPLPPKLPGEPPLAWASVQPYVPVEVLPSARQHTQRIIAMQTSTAPAKAQTQNQTTRPAQTPMTGQPKPKPQKNMKLGNRIRQSLGMPLREELNWWQRISWKIKAAIVMLVLAIVFALLHITVLAIIFGLLGAFLLITGLKKTFKVHRPWF